MDNRLLTVAKNRVMEELQSSLQRHPRYKDVQVYHKFHTLKERQQAGVILRGASATRIKLSADDHMGQFNSICNVSNVYGCPGTSIEWVWEDQQNLTRYYADANVTAYLQSDMQTVKLPTGVVITAGFSNLNPATNFAQVTAKVDGVTATVGAVQGTLGVVMLNKAIPRPTVPHTKTIVTTSLQPDMVTIQLSSAIITAGVYTVAPAVLPAAVTVFVNDVVVEVDSVGGATGTVVLANAVAAGAVVRMTYYTPLTTIDPVLTTNANMLPLLLPDRRTIQFGAGTFITAGAGTTLPAELPVEVVVRVNSVPVTVASVDGTAGTVVLATAVAAGAAVSMTYYSVTEAVLTMTFYVNNVDKPGYYLIDMLTDLSFQVGTMYIEEGETVIASTTGTESTATLSAGAVDLASPYYLYLKKYSYSDKFMLEPGTEYTLAADGTITFVVPLPVGSTLYASYRWQGETRGPFTLSGENTYNSTAVKGVVLAFAERGVAGDKQVVQLTKNRTNTASVSGGHYDMSFDILVYTRDPQSLSEMVDHVISDIWGNMRMLLIEEGYTIKDLDPTGEAEESYDDAAGIMYFQHSISLTMMTEWKKFYPYVVSVKKINLLLHSYPQVSSMVLDSKGLPKSFQVVPFDRAFEVVYPQTGYPSL